MPSPSKRLIVCVLFLLFFLGTTRPYSQGRTSPGKVVSRPTPTRPAGAADRVETFRLDRQRAATGRLDGHSVHRYTIELKHDQVFEAAVEQHGVDVSTSVFLPGGKNLFKIDSLSGKLGTERIFLLAKIPGFYSFNLQGNDPKGAYTLRVAAIRNAQPDDRLDAEAEELFYHARSISEKLPAQATREFLRAEGLWRSLGNIVRQANALERVALVQYDRPGDYGWERSIEACRKSLALYERVGDQRARARVFVLQGLAYRQVGDLQNAAKSYLQALKLAKLLALVSQEWDVLYNMASIHFVTGEYWGGIDYLDRALQLAERRKDTERQVKSLLGKSLLMKSMGKYNTAEEFLALAGQRLGKNGDSALWGQINARLSELYDLSGQPDKALDIAKQSLGQRQKAKDYRGEAVTLSTMALIYQSLKDLSQARESQERALSIFRRESYTAEEAIAQANLGGILLDQKDIGGAVEHFNQGLALARRQKLRTAEIMALFGLARAEGMRLNRISASRYLEELLVILEAMTRAKVSDDDQDIFLRTRHRSYELLTDLLIRPEAGSTPLKDLARAFEATESADWRGLLEGLQTAQERWLLHEQGNPVLLEELWNLQARIKKKEADRRWREANGKSVGTVVRDLEKLEEERRTAETQLRRSDPWALPEDLAVPVRLREAQAMLDADTVLLRFRLGEERSFLFFITTNSAEVYTLPRQAELEEYARRIHGQMSQRSLPQGAAIQMANELSEKLFGPVAGRLGTKRLVIVPDGGLNMVPFVGIPDPSSRRPGRDGWREPLLKRHEIVVVPSVSVLKAIRKMAASRKPPTKLLALLADPEFLPNHERLPYSRGEADKIWNLVDHERSLKALGPQASLRLVLSKPFGDYSIIHIATHAESHPKIPQLSSIILSQVDGAGMRVDGELRFDDIRNLYLRSDLVVLSACETALGEHVEGEGWVGLGHGFLYAGASRVVASLWNVNDRAAADLMEQFYKGMFVDHLTQAQALRKAQLWMAEKARSPYYWAGFQIQGEWR
jgi:CHAT domain-containing protein